MRAAALPCHLPEAGLAHGDMPTTKPGQDCTISSGKLWGWGRTRAAKSQKANDLDSASPPRDSHCTVMWSAPAEARGCQGI